MPKVIELHFIGNLVTVIILVPAIIWAAKNYGAIGAGWAWLSIQLAYLIFWVSFVHKIIEPHINLQWFKAFYQVFARFQCYAVS